MQYKTNSIQIASYLLTLDEITFEGVNKDNPTSVFFMFTPLDKAEELVNTKYYSGKARVNPIELFKNYRLLKDMIFDAKRTQL
jgi:hypothetical protein